MRLPHHYHQSAHYQLVLRLRVRVRSLVVQPVVLAGLVQPVLVVGLVGLCPLPGLVPQG